MDDKFFLAMVEKFNSSGIAELEFSDGNTRLLLRRDSTQPSAGAAAFAPVNKDKSAKQTPQDHSVRLGISAGEGEKINSPIVATYYSSPSPDALPFVKPGSKIKAGQTLCILEAMKMMNHLEAEFDCEIIEVHSSSGELVEYGQALFTVKRN